MNTLVWFRSDLRADDNPALQAAMRSGGAIHGLFLAAPEQWRRHQWGPRRQAFVWQQMLALRTELASRGIPLHVEVAPRFADAAQQVLTTARRVAAARVLASTEHATDELARDTKVAATLAECGLQWQSLHQFTALVPGTVRTRSGEPFRVFSAFRREWLAQARRMTIGGVGAVRVSAPVEPPPLPGWRPPEADIDSTLWPAGEQAALRRLGEFISTRLDRYHVDRDFPARDGTSRLSPYLSTGTLSVRRCFEAALAANAGEWDSGCAGACTWINELIWREFYVHVLQAFPAVSRHRALRPETESVRWHAPGDEFVRWQRGLTGFPLVDAGMRELAATGWMHNRVRMMTATFLSKHLLIDWRHGERHFMHELLDGELAANNGGWQWCASCGTDAAPYFRVMSPARQALRFDAQGDYIRRHLPELAGCSTRALHTPGHPELLATGYPAPVVDATQARERAVAAYRDATAGHPRCA